ncbi:hypothetical protein BESB_053820 [Besnoitia besnoiti]|uniref:Uncharacterized protein n=1 Tax=Besnoitia besnoiti TaxID=94643 RepID=A0A2A9MHI6_BESBE|nr:hypothetical protein BESB_053820 [Besnoitia besnoiti]PFH35731.1 hypothetical protein BESB_053820 [Besnoitia besnoiti]
MDKHNLTNLDVECLNALKVLLKPRYLYLIEPWLMNAKQEQKKALIMAADYVEGKTWATLLPAVQKDRYGLRRPTATRFRSLDQAQYAAEWPNTLKREGTNNRARHTSEIAECHSLNRHPVKQEAYAFLLHPVAAAKIEDWQVTEGTEENKATLAAALRSLKFLQEKLPGYDDKSIPSGVQPNDRLYLESYCRRIRAEPACGELGVFSQGEKRKQPQQAVAHTTPHAHYLESHLYLPFTTGDYTTTNQRMMEPPPPGLGVIYSSEDDGTEAIKKNLISPIILSEKLALQ